MRVKMRCRQILIKNNYFQEILQNYDTFCEKNMFKLPAYPFRIVQYIFYNFFLLIPLKWLTKMKGYFPKESKLIEFLDSFPSF